MKKIPMPLIMLVLSLALAAGTNRTLHAEQKEVVNSIELPVLAFDLADGAGRDKVSVFCGICHGPEYIPMQPKLSKAQWTATVMKMIKTFGAPVPQEDEDKIINYLATAYGTGK
jgi:sulfite dehydrogenase (cytochrome) subunit B